jgi:opacity protein-like surface antigen
MKKWFVIVMILSALVVSAQADSTRKVSIYIAGGVSPLSGDFGKVWNMGFHGSFGIGMPVAEGLQVVPKVEYHSFPMDKHGYTFSGGTLSSLMFGADMRYEVGTSAMQARPLFLGGVGVSRASISTVSDGSESLAFDSETKIYFEFGAGVSFKTGGAAKIFATIRYTSVALEGTSLNYIPLTVGVAF